LTAGIRRRPRRHAGPALDGRFRPARIWRLGDRRRARYRRRSAERNRLAAGVQRPRGRNFGGAAGAAPGADGAACKATIM